MDMLQDAHSHIQDSGNTATVKALLDYASAAGIKRVFSDSDSPLNFQPLKELACRQDIVPFFGLHPWRAESAPPDWLRSLKETIETIPACGIGEIGLDKGRRGTGPVLQEKIFCEQLGLASETARPVTLHCVKAWKELLDVLKRYGSKLPPLLLHAFSGPGEALKELIGLGAFISFSPRALLSGDPEVEKALFAVSTDRLLLETDFPYRCKGEINGRTYVELLTGVYAKAAELLRVERPELEERLWNNGTLFTHGITDR